MSRRWMQMAAAAGLCLAISPLAHAQSLELRIVMGPDGARVHSARPIQDAPDLAVPGAPAIDVFSSDGKHVGAASFPDPRMRTVIAPEGGHGDAATLITGVTRVRVPWPVNASELHFDGKRLALPSVTLDPHPRPPPGVAIEVRNTGPSEERLDLVFVGDGYTSSQQDTFADDVERMVDYLLSIEPYGEYDQLFNIWRVEVDSNQSGATHEEVSPPVYRDTALSCYYGCAGLARLTCCDDFAVLDAVLQSVPSADGIMVLINDPKYGGSGGFNYATSYTGLTDGHQVVAHELGHSLVGLWDEYSYEETGGGTGPNCVADSTGGWDSWIGTSGVDAYPTCSWTNYYRPTEDECMMRTLRDDYCPVCRQEAVLAMYGKLPGLISSTDPSPSTIDATGTARDEVGITVQTNAPRNLLTFSWELDGTPVGDKANLALSCQDLNGELYLTVSDPTPWVRDDPQELLTERLGPWQVSSATCDDEEVKPLITCATGNGPQGAFAMLLALVAVRRRR